MPANFVHLHVHSEYSLSSGLIRVDEIISSAKEHGQTAVALTDINNMFATVKFYQQALASGIKPVIGLELTIRHDDKKYGNIVLLAQNSEGYKNLKVLMSRSYLEGQKLGKVFCDFAWLNGFSAGLIVLSGGINSDINHAFLSGNEESAHEILKKWVEMFSGRFYLELVRVDKKNEERVIDFNLALAARYKLPVAASNDVFFLKAADYNTHEARVCIYEGLTLDNSRRKSLYSPRQYMPSGAEMENLFSDIPEALVNTVEIAKRCTVEIELGKSYLPAFQLPENMNAGQYLTAIATKGLRQRLDKLYPETKNKAKLSARYDERLTTELEVIIGMGYPGYFLIVADFVKWAKQNRIPVGPGRGSGAGSLVAFALHITELDPLKYGLLFERFLNPERISMPDFDIDFCMEGRDRVIEYVADKYGADRVSQIITFGSMNAKAVVRDAGRVLGRPYGMVDGIAKLIPFDLNMTLAKALTESAELKTRYDNEEEVKEIIDLARPLEGLKRNAGKHAGGVVISPSDINDFTPVYCEENSTSQVSQFDKDDVEAVGLVKFDFLGLRTLTVIKWALENIREEKIDIDSISLDDKKVYKMLQTGNTLAIFQLESRGMRDLIVRLKPSCFEDIVALVALYRPGPLGSGMVDDFIAVKHGEKTASYPHSKLKEILAPTYGIMVYQEQVMQIAQVLAGYSLGEADILRRAMGKKKTKEMAAQKDRFIQGATAKGVTKTVADKIFALMEKFAEYGFNKSHSAAYALVAYQTAWLKTYYPAQYMASVLSADMHHTDKVVMMIEETSNLDIKILPPDINFSAYRFKVNDTGAIVYGLGAIKCVGKAAIDVILGERNRGGLYRSLKDFCCRIDAGKINKQAVEALIRAGAMDSLSPNEGDRNRWDRRSTLLASIPNALAYAGQRNRNIVSGQVDMFSFDQDDDKSFCYKASAPMGEEERLYGEKAALGLFLTGHPLDRYLSDLEKFAGKISELDQSGCEALLAGLLVGISGKKTKSLKIDDKSGQMEVVAYVETWEKYHNIIEKDKLLIINGKTRQDNFSGSLQLVADTIYDYDGARETFGKYLEISGRIGNNEEIDELKSTLSPFAGTGVTVKLNYCNDRAGVPIWFGKKWKVKPAIELETRLNKLKWVKEVKLVYN